MQEDTHKHVNSVNGKQEDVESSKVIETIVGIPKRANTSSNSPLQEGDKGECAKYKSSFNQVSFDYDKHGKSSHNIGENLHVPFLV